MKKVYIHGELAMKFDPTRTDLSDVVDMLECEGWEVTESWYDEEGNVHIEATGE